MRAFAQRGDADAPLSASRARRGPLPGRSRAEPNSLTEGAGVAVPAGAQCPSQGPAMPSNTTSAMSPTSGPAVLAPMDQIVAESEVRAQRGRRRLELEARDRHRMLAAHAGDQERARAQRRVRPRIEPVCPAHERGVRFAEQARLHAVRRARIRRRPSAKKSCSRIAKSQVVRSELRLRPARERVSSMPSPGRPRQTKSASPATDICSVLRGEMARSTSAESRPTKICSWRPSQEQPEPGDGHRSCAYVARPAILSRVRSLSSPFIPKVHVSLAANAPPSPNCSGARAARCPPGSRRPGGAGARRRGRA